LAFGRPDGSPTVRGLQHAHSDL